MDRSEPACRICERIERAIAPSPEDREKYNENSVYIILLAVGLRLRRMGNHSAACDLRRDQECRNHRGQANQSQKLIHRKHSLSPKTSFQQATSVRPLRSLLFTDQKLICVGSAGKREQRQNRNNGQCVHGEMVGSDCGQKCQSLAHFRGQHRNNHGRRAGPGAWA